VKNRFNPEPPPKFPKKKEILAYFLHYIPAKQAAGDKDLLEEAAKLFLECYPGPGASIHHNELVEFFEKNTGDTL
jgi:hypothetical protein